MGPLCGGPSGFGGVWSLVGRGADDQTNSEAMATRQRALSTAIRYQTKAEKLLAAAPLPKRVGTCLKLDLAPWAPTPHLAAAANASLEAIREAAAGMHYKAAVIDASNITGSDVAALAAAPGEERASHYRDVAHLLRTLGEAELPSVAVLDGCVTGSTIGLGAHASICVVTERTRASLPGPAYGFLTESFAAYQLTRLPEEYQGVGAYLMLTGATLTGQELVDIGLATHSTESQAIGRIEAEVRHQRARHLGRTIRTVETGLIEPRRVECVLWAYHTQPCTLCSRSHLLSSLLFACPGTPTPTPSIISTRSTRASH